MGPLITKNSTTSSKSYKTWTCMMIKFMISLTSLTMMEVDPSKWKSWQMLCTQLLRLNDLINIIKIILYENQFLIF